MHEISRPNRFFTPLRCICLLAVVALIVLGYFLGEAMERVRYAAAASTSA